MSAEREAARIVAALVQPVIGTDRNGHRINLTSQQAYALVPTVAALAAAAGGREAATRVAGHHPNCAQPLGYSCTCEACDGLDAETVEGTV